MKVRSLFLVLFMTIVFWGNCFSAIAAESVLLTIEQTGKDSLAYFVTEVAEDDEYPGERVKIRHNGRVIGVGEWNSEAGTLTIRASGLDPEAYKLKGATTLYPFFIEAKAGAILVTGPKVNKSDVTKKVDLKSDARPPSNWSNGDFEIIVGEGRYFN